MFSQNFHQGQEIAQEVACEVEGPKRSFCPKVCLQWLVLLSEVPFVRVSFKSWALCGLEPQNKFLKPLWPVGICFQGLMETHSDELYTKTMLFIWYMCCFPGHRGLVAWELVLSKCLVSREFQVPRQGFPVRLHEPLFLCSLQRKGSEADTATGLLLAGSGPFNPCTTRSKGQANKGLTSLSLSSQPPRESDWLSSSPGPPHLDWGWGHGMAARSWVPMAFGEGGMQGRSSKSVGIRVGTWNLFFNIVRVSTSSPVH